MFNLKLLKRLLTLLPFSVFYALNTIRPINKLQTKRSASPLFIVTLTSYGRRVFTKCPFAILSLLNQSVQPDKIVLWLGHGTKVPSSLKKLEKYGLEIRFCEDIRSYKKLIPALTEFPNDALITVDDDVYYDYDWFRPLKEAYLSDTTKIYCYRAHEISLDENKNVIPYINWRKKIKTTEHPNRIFPTGVGGIIYPPHCFNSEVFNKDIFQKLVPYADDVWFWAMAKHNKKEHEILKDSGNKFISIRINNDGLRNINVGKNKNDEQLQSIINKYPNIYHSLL